jgi:hypothetical protein
MVKWDSEKNEYIFETSCLMGRFCPTGFKQGITSLVHKTDGTDIIAVNRKNLPHYGLYEGDNLFILDTYHYLAENLTAGVIGRKMQGTYYLDSNKVFVELNPSSECHIKTSLEYSFEGENIDVSVCVKSEKLYKNFDWIGSCFFCVEIFSIQY